MINDESQVTSVSNPDNGPGGIFWTGGFEQSYIPIILKEIYIDRVYAPFLEGRSDLTIVDAGANVGLTAMYFSQFARRVIALEPDKRHLLALDAMLAYNGIANAELNNVEALFAAGSGLQE